MKEQNFKNHSRLVPGFHGFTWLAIVILLIASFVNLFLSGRVNIFSNSLICLISLILVCLSWYAREFPMKVQDRVIRAEENLRHYVLTGKLLDAKLKISQVIALRFAGDDEFANLAKRAVDEKLSGKQIKEAIQSWKADHHRA